MPDSSFRKRFEAKLAFVKAKYPALAKVETPKLPPTMEHYDERMPDTFHPGLAALLAYFEGRPLEGLKLVHLGGGYGQLEPWVRDNGGKLFTLDRSRVNLTAGRKAGMRGHLQGLAEKLPFKEHSVHGFFAEHFLYSDYPYVSDRKALAEIRRAISPDGVLVLHNVDPEALPRDFDRHWDVLLKSRARKTGPMFTVVATPKAPAKLQLWHKK